MRNPGLFLQIRMETPESLPEVILDGERITLIQSLELVVDASQIDPTTDAVKFRLKHHETATERNTVQGGSTEIYKESALNAPRYKYK